VKIKLVKNEQVEERTKMSGEPPTLLEEGAEPKRGRPRSKRDQIVRAAIKVFLENGYAATSMNRVAEEADVIKATIYSHFADKEQLFTAIIEEIVLAKIGIDFEHLEDMLRPMDIDAFMEFLLSRFLRLADDAEYLALIRLIIGESGRFPELADLYLKAVVLRGMKAAKVFFELHREYAVPDPLAAAHVVTCSFWSLLVWQKLLGGSRYMPLDPVIVRDTVVKLIRSQVESLDCRPAQDS